MLGHKVLDTSAIVISQGAARMLVAACAECSLLCVPRLLRCSRCGSARFAPSLLDPAGVLYAFSEVAVAPRGWKVPYLVGYVDLHAGVRLFARLAFDKTVARPGMAVELELLPCPGQVGQYYYQFCEASEAAPLRPLEASLADAQGARAKDLTQGRST